MNLSSISLLVFRSKILDLKILVLLNLIDLSGWRRCGQPMGSAMCLKSPQRAREWPSLIFCTLCAIGAEMALSEALRRLLTLISFWGSERDAFTA